MNLKKMLILPLTVNFLFAYSVIGFKSGTTIEAVRKKMVYTGDFNNDAAAKMGFFQAFAVGKTEFSYIKTIFNEKALVYQYFTRKSKKLYKTEINWDSLVGAFPATLGFDEKEKRKFAQKVKKLLSKKYKKDPKRKNVFIIDSHSIVKLSTGPTNVKLTYIDTRFVDKAKKEQKIYKQKQKEKEFKKAFKEL